MSSVNLYDVLKLPFDCTNRDIKKAYNRLAKKYHPDRRGGDSDYFELINYAYSTLSNRQKRQAFDQEFFMTKRSELDHFDLKSQAQGYFTSQQTSIVNNDIEDQQKNFKEACKDLDRKHSYDRDVTDGPLEPSEIRKRFNDLQNIRDHENIENMPEKIFDSKKISMNKFNAVFDAMHQTHNELVPHTGNPDAWNSVNSMENNFSAAYGDYENIYAENDDNLNGAFYGSANFDNTVKKKISRNDVQNIQPTDYTNNHNQIDKDYDPHFNKHLQKRNVEDNRYNSMNHEDYNNDPTMGGYGITHDIGLDTLNWSNDGDIKKKYNRLLYERRNNV